MRRSTLLLVAIALAASALFVRLGFWQLGRLHDRKARNAIVAARMDSSEIGIERVPTDTGLARYRRVTLGGGYDFDHEVILANRTHRGSPGVHLYTPLRIPGRDTAVMVVRGWIYAPDAMTVDDQARWRQSEDATVHGFVIPFPGPGRGDPVIRSHVRTLRHPDLAAMRELVPYPIAPYYVVQTDTIGFDVDSTPARLAPPALDEGPHLSYALQWFSFAAIAIGGVALLIMQGRGGGRRK